MALTFKDITDKFKALTDAGFVANEEEQAITFERILLGRTEKLRISHNYRIQSGFYIHHVTASIQFHTLEELFNAVMEKYPFPSNYQVHRSSTAWSGAELSAIEGVDYEVFDKQIDDLKQWDKASIEVWKILRGGALPFLEKYNRLEAINEEADKRTLQELIGFIESPPPVRRLLIKKFCHDPGFEEYAAWIVKAAADSPPELQEAYKNIIEYVRAYTV